MTDRGSTGEVADQPGRRNTPGEQWMKASESARHPGVEVL
jgi:hypothetical protein